MRAALAMRLYADCVLEIALVTDALASATAGLTSVPASAVSARA